MSKTIKILFPHGGLPRTSSVRMENAETHVAARDGLAEEAALLLQARKCVPGDWVEIESGVTKDGTPWSEYEIS